MESIPVEVLAAEVLARCAEYAPALRAVCRLWRARARALSRQSGGRGLSFLAAQGCAGLLAWVLQQTGKPYFSALQANQIFLAAAPAGHVSLCIKALAWGARAWSALIGAAARWGHATLCEIVRNRAPAWSGFGASHYDVMLCEAAKGGHLALCLTAREWGATNLNDMLYGAALGGHVPVCAAARESGATDWDRMLCAAAQEGHLEVCASGMDQLLSAILCEDRF